MNKYKNYLIAAALVAVGAFLFYNKIYLPKTTYERLSPQKGDFDVTIFGIGTLSANNIYTINAQNPGKIERITKDAGDWVKKGELLVRMDSVDMPMLLQEAQISVKKAKLEREASQKELESLLAQRSLSLVTYKRYKRLFEQKFASKAEYDKAKAELESIDAQIAATKARIESAAAETKRAQKASEALEAKLSRYEIYAPVDGYVIARGSDEQESVLTNTPILTVVDPKSVWVVAYVDERISGGISKGDKAIIRLRSKESQLLAGYVKRIAPQSDPITQEREIDVAFESLPTPFFINEQAEVDVTTKQLKDAVIVPSKLLRFKEKNAGIWIEKDGKAHFAKVKVLGNNGKESAVEGIESSATLLVESAEKKALKEGMRVH